MALGNIGAPSSPHIWLNKGWSHLRDYAHSAMTHFKPDKSETNVNHASEAPTTGCWGILAADVLDHEGDIEIRFEVPGMSKSDLEVEFIQGQLVVRGEKHMTNSRKQGGRFITERAFGHFERIIPLPGAVNADQAKASYQDGVLVVIVPKSSDQQGSQIQIG